MLVAAYLLEAGLLLTVSPWTSWWQQNFFAARWPWLDAIMMFNAARVAVSAAGLVTAFAGITELRDVWVRHLRRRGSQTP